MIAGHQHIGPMIKPGIGTLYRLRQSVNIGGVCIILGNGAHRWLAFFRGQGRKKRIVCCGRGGPRVMRIKREEQYLFTPGLHHRRHFGFGRRVAIAHAEINHHGIAMTLRKRRRYRRRLILCDRQQRAFIFILVPDQFVIRTTGKGPFGQDNQLQQRLPFPIGNIDHAFVGQKFVKIPPHRPIIIAVRRAKVGQKNADLGPLNHRVRGGRMGKSAGAG